MHFAQKNRNWNDTGATVNTESSREKQEKTTKRKRAEPDSNYSSVIRRHASLSAFCFSSLANLGDVTLLAAKKPPPDRGSEKKKRTTFERYMKRLRNVDRGERN